MGEILRGDCLKILPTLPKESVDLIIADPPYNIGVDYAVYKDRKKKTEYYKWMYSFFKRFERVLRESGSIYIINLPENNAFLLNKISRRELCQGEASLFPSRIVFQHWLTWYYPTNIGHSKRNWTNATRSILHFSKGNFFKFRDMQSLIFGRLTL